MKTSAFLRPLPPPSTHQHPTVPSRAPPTASPPMLSLAAAPLSFNAPLVADGGRRLSSSTARRGGEAACAWHRDPEHGDAIDGAKWARPTFVVSCGEPRRFAFRPFLLLKDRLQEARLRVFPAALLYGQHAPSEVRGVELVDGLGFDAFVIEEPCGVDPKQDLGCTS